MPDIYMVVEKFSHFIRSIFFPPLSLRGSIGAIAIFSISFPLLYWAITGWSYGDDIGIPILYDFLLLFVPAIASVEFVPRLTGLGRESISFNTVIAVIFLSLFYLGGGNLLVLGCIFLFAFQHTLYMVICASPPHKVAPAAAVHPFLTLALMWIGLPFDPSKFVLSFFVLLSVGYAVYISISTQLKRGVGFDVERGLRTYLRGIKGEVMGINDLLGGEEREMNVDVILMRRGKKIKATFITTNIHPGVAKGEGANDLPSKIAQKLEDMNAIFFKGASTHETDPCEDVSDEICRIVRQSVDEMRYTSRATNFVQAIHGNAKVTALPLRDCVFIYSTFAPDPSDDVDPRIGDDIRRICANYGLGSFYVECHNVHGTRAAVYPGDPRAEYLTSACNEAIRKGLAEAERRLRVGVSRRGRASVIVMETYPEGSRRVLVVLDENNIAENGRGRIIEALSQIVSPAEVEVFTTDCHDRIDAFHIHNPLRVDEDLLKELKEMVEDAISQMEDVDVGYVSKKIRVKVLGSSFKRFMAFGKMQVKIAATFYIPIILIAYLFVIILWVL